jgi:hypothetical protein
VGRRRLGSVAWLGLILAGCCLGAFVFAAWPEPSTYRTRLPHGESRPKTPTVAAERQAPVTRVISSASVDVVTAAAAATRGRSGTQTRARGAPSGLIGDRERRHLSPGDCGGARREAPPGHAPGRRTLSGYAVASAVRRMPTSCRAVISVIASPVRPATVKLSCVPPRSTSQPAKRPPTGANPANAQR